MCFIANHQSWGAPKEHLTESVVVADCVYRGKHAPCIGLVSICLDHPYIGCLFRPYGLKGSGWLLKEFLAVGQPQYPEPFLASAGDQ
jgi:hypothetical protein